jgi:hypothetical protein
MLLGDPLPHQLKDPIMTRSQFSGVARAVLAYVAGMGVAKGWLPAEGLNEAVSGLALLLTAWWSVNSNRA